APVLHQALLAGRAEHTQISRSHRPIAIVLMLVATTAILDLSTQKWPRHQYARSKNLMRPGVPCVSCHLVDHGYKCPWPLLGRVGRKYPGSANGLGVPPS